ncbi:MAG: hypothetical protein RLZZ15_364 [Verrucomicrobiota bacterium]|jgi:hypothetical protein
MNVTDPKHPWSRLAAAARTAQPAAADTAPYGFATRVVALAFAHEHRVVSLFERFSLRAVGVAGLLAVISLAGNYSLLSAGGPTDDDPPEDDAVSLLLED